jgi:hypothetical protein
VRPVSTIFSRIDREADFYEMHREFATNQMPQFREKRAIPIPAVQRKSWESFYKLPSHLTTQISPKVSRNAILYTHKQPFLYLTYIGFILSIIPIRPDPTNSHKTNRKLPIQVKQRVYLPNKYPFSDELSYTNKGF